MVVEYQVFGTETYLKELAKLDKSERDIAEKIPQKLYNKGFGKPLCTLKNLRTEYLTYNFCKLMVKK